MKILFTPITSSSIAHMIRSFALAERYIRIGHKVYFTSCHDKRKFIESKGYEVVESYTPYNLNDPKDQSINYLAEHRKEMVEWFQTEIRVAKKIKPDIVISSPSFFGCHVTHATGIPTVALMNGQYVPNSKGLMGISKSSDSLSDKFTRALFSPIFNKKFIKQYLKYVLEAYDEIGIKENITNRAELYKKMLMLIPGDEEFEPIAYDMKNVKHVGPIFWDGFERMETDLTDEFISEFKGQSKLLFVNFGGSVFSIEVYNRIIEALGRIEAKKIIALGPNFNRSAFQKDSENIVIRNLVPGLRVAKHADILINTGSQGAIMQAMVCGKPVVSFPVGIDQAYFANRLEELGFGRNINKSNLLNFSKRESYQFVDNRIPDNMVATVSDILYDTNIWDNVQKYSIRVKERYPDTVEETTNIINKYIQNGC